MPLHYIEQLITSQVRQILFDLVLFCRYWRLAAFGGNSKVWLCAAALLPLHCSAYATLQALQ